MPQSKSNIIAVDPGTLKIGLAVLENSGQILARKIVAPENLTVEIKSLATQFQPEKIILGRGTGRKLIVKELKKITLPVTEQEEKFSTMEARKLYWQLNPPRGWRRLVPAGLRLPPEPVDDFAAVVIGRKYLGTDTIF